MASWSGCYDPHQRQKEAPAHAGGNLRNSVYPRGQNSIAFPRHGLRWMLVFSSILLISLVLTCKTASADVVSVVDEHGHRIFINLEAPKPKPASPAVQNVSAKVGTPETGFTTVKPGTVASPPAATAPKAEDSNGPLTNDRLESLIKTVAERHNVDPGLVRAVIRTESNGDPAAVSMKGAQGLMQLMPSTAAELGVTNTFNPQENIEGGVKYLRQLLTRYGGDLDKALAAYNAGAGAVDRAKGVPRYRETQEYVRKVTSSYLNGAPARAGTKTASNPSHPMYQTTDAQGHIIWVND